jgi:hypothetical protein
MATSIEIAGLTVQAPVTAFTNLLLSVQCATYCRRLWTGQRDRGGNWALFFLAMAVATLAGVPKHGLKQSLPGDVYLVILWISSLGSAASVYFAQRATLVSCTSSVSALFRVVCALQACVFVGASVALGPEMWLIVVNTAVGLIPVIFAECCWIRAGSRQSAWIVAGLCLSMLTGVVYMVRLSVGVWLNHIDIAHVLMGVSFFLMARGSPDSGTHFDRDSARGLRPTPEAVGLIPMEGRRA